jgi:hypothetical protein
MIFSAHRIADIEFYTQSDIQLSGIHNASTSRYLSLAENTEISQYIHQITSRDLTGPPLNTYELNQIKKCEIPTSLGRGGVQILPLTVIVGQEEKYTPYLAYHQSLADLPILRDPGLRDRLSVCLEHAGQVTLILHPLTVEIRDYAAHRIDIYFPDILSEILQTSLAHNGVERIFRIFLPEFDALMIHSSAVIRKGKAIFFLAPDEGGKTSVAEQAVRTSVLGDDQVILRKQEAGFMAHSTPWGQIVNDPISAPLGVFFLLEKSRQFGLVPVKPREVIEFLWSEQENFVKGAPNRLRTKIFDFIREAVHNVPLYKLRTPLNGIDWDRIDACV